MQRGFSDDALRLVGPDGVLPADVERPLLALATHPQLGTPVFGALKAGYRVIGASRGAVATLYSRVIVTVCGRSATPPPEPVACTRIDAMSSRTS